MRIGKNGAGCIYNTECASGQCYKSNCLDAKLSCSATKSCAAGLVCSGGKCFCKC